MAIFRVTVPTPVHLFHPKVKLKRTNFEFQSKVFLRISLKSFNSCKSSLFHLSTPTNSLRKSQTYPLPSSLSSLDPIIPYVQLEWRSILKGWICSVISVYCLSRVVPEVGKFSAILTKIDVSRMKEEGLVLGLLVMVRLVANYFQQAFLWDAALNSVYKTKDYVFEKVLQRDLSFYEGEAGVLAGDIAYRITAEASDVADTVYALLNVSKIQ